MGSEMCIRDSTNARLTCRGSPSSMVRVSGRVVSLVLKGHHVDSPEYRTRLGTIYLLQMRVSISSKTKSIRLKSLRLRSCSLKPRSRRITSRRWVACPAHYSTRMRRRLYPSNCEGIVHDTVNFTLTVAIVVCRPLRREIKSKSKVKVLDFG